MKKFQKLDIVLALVVLTIGVSIVYLVKATPLGSYLDKDLGLYVDKGATIEGSAVIGKSGGDLKIGKLDNPVFSVGADGNMTSTGTLSVAGGKFTIGINGDVNTIGNVNVNRNGILNVAGGKFSVDASGNITTSGTINKGQAWGGLFITGSKCTTKNSPGVLSAPGLDDPAACRDTIPYTYPNPITGSASCPSGYKGLGYVSMTNSYGYNDPFFDDATVYVFGTQQSTNLVYDKHMFICLKI